MMDSMSPKDAIGRYAVRDAPWILPAAFLGLYCAVVLWVRHDFFFHDAIVPIGDHAADDLLIYKAKSFHLLVGNYSRVGFNHPGPFFLQVAALGEALFHDTLHLFASYAAAQVFTVSLLQGISLALAFRLWLLITRDPAASILAVLTLVAVISATWTRNIFLVYWNPHSYVAGAVFLATGLTGLWTRGLRWAPLAALGAVALVQGHASFIGLVPVMLLVFAVLMAVYDRRALISDPLILARLARAEPWSSAAALAVLAAGVAPILINLALNGPEQLKSYFTFAHQGHPNGKGAALAYVWAYIPFLGVWLGLFLIPAKVRNFPPALKRLCAAAVGVFIAGSAAALLYAWRGVDDIHQTYLIIWFGAFVGMAAAAASIILATALNRVWLRAGLILLACLACWACLRHKDIGDADAAVAMAETQDIQNAATQIQALAPAGQRIAFNLSMASPVWPEMWSETVSIAAVLQRRGSHALCVQDGWHILFTKAYACAASDTIARSVFLAPADQPPAGAPAFHFGHFLAYSPGFSLGSQAVPTNFGPMGVELGRDWSSSEGGWIWSDGPSPSLSIRMLQAPPKAVTLTLRGRVFSDGKTPQTVSLLDAGGRVLATASALSGDIILKAPMDLSGRNGTLTVNLAVAHPLSPQSLGQSGDARQLGFGIEAVQLDPAP